MNKQINVVITNGCARLVYYRDGVPCFYDGYKRKYTPLTEAELRCPCGYTEDGRSRWSDCGMPGEELFEEVQGG